MLNGNDSAIIVALSSSFELTPEGSVVGHVVSYVSKELFLDICIRVAPKVLKNDFIINEDA